MATSSGRRHRRRRPPAERPWILPVIVAVPGSVSSSELAAELSKRLGARIDTGWIRLVPSQGAPAGYAAIAMARECIARGTFTHCLVAAADSLIGGRALLALETAGRLLTDKNPDGVV